MGQVGALDILVNNAGITGFEGAPAAHDPEHASLADWRHVHAVNLDGTFLGCRAAIRAMRPAGKGRPAVRFIARSTSTSYHWFSAPLAPAPSAIARMAVKPRTG